MNIFKIFSVSVLFLVMAGCTTKPTIVYCPPDSRPVTVYSAPAKAFKDYANSYDFNLKGLQTTLDKYNAKLGIGSTELKTKITLLQDKLNQRNIEHKNTLKSIAISQQTNPCDPESNQRLFAYLDKLSSNALELERMKSSFNKSIDKGDEQGVEEVVDDVEKKESVDSPSDVESNSTEVGILKKKIRENV